MLAKRIGLMLVVVLVMALSASTVLAKGGGPPAGEMKSFAGHPYFRGSDETWWLQPASGAAVKLDFGPEYYVPDPCLNKLIESHPLEEPIKVGKNVIGTFKKSGEVYKALDSAGDEYIPLMLNKSNALGRPIGVSDAWVYGRVELKFTPDGTPYEQVLPWEVKYDGGGRHWWRSSGQPWIRAKLLDCPPAGDR